MTTEQLVQSVLSGNSRGVARAISLIENDDPRAFDILKQIYPRTRPVPVIGITGPAGVGKSSLVDRLIDVYRARNLQVGVVAVDPTSPFTGGAILGDRIRMQGHGTDPSVFIRSMATRGKLGGIAAATFDVIDLLNAAGKDIILVETVGVGQDEVDIVKVVDTTIVVLMPGLGDEVQAMKAGLMEIADLLVINKADRADAEKMEMELQTTLQFFHTVNEWRPQILKTVATANQGIESVVAAIEEHEKYLRETGKVQEKKLKQSRQRLIDALEYQVITQILEQGFEKFGVSEWIQDIADRKTDPHTAVQELLKHFKME